MKVVGMPRCDMNYRWEENLSMPINPEVFPRLGVGLEEPLKRDADVRCRDRQARVGCCLFFSDGGPGGRICQLTSICEAERGTQRNGKQALPSRSAGLPGGCVH